MGEKLIAGLVAAGVVAPLCVTCILGPAVVASLLAGVGGWFAGLESITVVALAAFAGFLVIGIIRRRRARTPETEGLSTLSSREQNRL